MEGTRLTEAEVACDVITRREGVLSAVGHDLRIRATRSSWTVDAVRGALEGAVDARALRVQCALEGDRDHEGALSAGDKEKIERSMRDEVLDAGRHPEVKVRATFTRDGDRATVEGFVTVRGVERPFRASARREGGRWRAEATLDQTAFGITPYRAMMGALKVSRDVAVRVSVDDAALAAG